MVQLVTGCTDRGLLYRPPGILHGRPLRPLRIGTTLFSASRPRAACSATTVTSFPHVDAQPVTGSMLHRLGRSSGVRAPDANALPLGWTLPSAAGRGRDSKWLSGATGSPRRNGADRDSAVLGGSGSRARKNGTLEEFPCLGHVVMGRPVLRSLAMRVGPGDPRRLRLAERRAVALHLGRKRVRR